MPEIEPVEVPRPRRIPTLVDLDARLTMIADSVLDTNERLGHVMRTTALVQSDVREIRAELTEMRSDEREMRRKLDSVPEMIESVAERTGRHDITELEKRLAVEQRDEARGALVRKEEHHWKLAAIVLAAALSVVGSILVWLLTHGK